jgi:hypothetical protein
MLTILNCSVTWAHGIKGKLTFPATVPRRAACYVPFPSSFLAFSSIIVLIGGVSQSNSLYIAVMPLLKILECILRNSFCSSL